MAIQELPIKVALMVNGEKRSIRGRFALASPRTPLTFIDLVDIVKHGTWGYVGLNLSRPVLAVTNLQNHRNIEAVREELGIKGLFIPYATWNRKDIALDQLTCNFKFTREQAALMAASLTRDTIDPERGLLISWAFKREKVSFWVNPETGKLE